MRSAVVRFLPALAVVLVGVSVWARAGRPGSAIPLVELLQNKGVIEELKLSPDQLEQLKKSTAEIQAKIDQARNAGDFEKHFTLSQERDAAFPKTVETVLKPEQRKRFSQIVVWADVQRFGRRILLDQERIANAINLTDKQKQQLEDSFAVSDKVLNEITKTAKSKVDAEVDAKVAVKQVEFLEQFLSSLTDDQKKAWKDLVGEKFTLEMASESRKK